MITCKCRMPSDAFRGIVVQVIPSGAGGGVRTSPRRAIRRGPASYVKIGKNWGFVNKQRISGGNKQQTCHISLFWQASEQTVCCAYDSIQRHLYDNYKMETCVRSLSCFLLYAYLRHFLGYLLITAIINCFVLLCQSFSISVRTLTCYENFWNA